MWDLLALWQVFMGNTNPTDVVKTSLPRPTLTRFLRIRPFMWETGIALRFEVYGCKISGGFSGLSIYPSCDLSKVLFICTNSHQISVQDRSHVRCMHPSEGL